MHVNEFILKYMCVVNFSTVNNNIMTLYVNTWLSSEFYTVHPILV